MMELDRNGLEVLDERECRVLLGGVSIGRVGLSIRAMPVVLPVNFALLPDAIVVCTSPGSKLEAACNHAIVAFQADGVDLDDRTGWSVLVQGRAALMDPPASLVSHPGALRLKPWGNVAADNFIRISMDLVSGRRVRRPAG